MGLFKKDVFVSYNYDKDKHYKRLLTAWAANRAIEFDMQDRSVDVSVGSRSAGPIRRVISQRIRRSDCLLCIVGQHTWASDWVDWEIRKAIEHEKPLVAVKTVRSYRPPGALIGSGAKWVMSFNREGIVRAIETLWW